MHDVHVNGWRMVNNGDRLRYLLEQISNDVADDLLGQECTIHWYIELRLDTYVIRAVGKSHELATFYARFHDSDFVFTHKDSPTTLKRMSEIVLVAITPMEEPVGI